MAAPVTADRRFLSGLGGQAVYPGRFASLSRTTGIAAGAVSPKAMAAFSAASAASASSRLRA
jgi:hypothetical protein